MNVGSVTGVYSSPVNFGGRFELVGHAKKYSEEFGFSRFTRSLVNLTKALPENVTFALKAEPPARVLKGPSILIDGINGKGFLHEGDNLIELVDTSKRFDINAINGSGEKGFLSRWKRVDGRKFEYSTTMALDENPKIDVVIGDKIIGTFPVVTEKNGAKLFDINSLKQVKLTAMRALKDAGVIPRRPKIEMRADRKVKLDTSPQYPASADDSIREIFLSSLKPGSNQSIFDSFPIQ